jgi:hypothetical protein
VAAFAAPVRFVIAAPPQSVLAADRVQVARRPIWPADMPSDLRPARTPSPDVQMLSILHGRYSG